MKKDIVFVILHYLTEQYTIKCVEYIEQNCDTESYHIVIVDNASPNNSYDVLKKRFHDDRRVSLILNKTNMGFARGNNVGIRYAVNECKGKFVVVLNNDVFLTEKELYRKIEKEYEYSHFAVAGPKITDITDEGNANPHGTEIFTIDFCKFMIRRKRLDLLFTRINLYRVLQLARRILNKIGLYNFPKLPKINTYIINDNKLVHESQSNIYGCNLHGCCLIFSPNYFNIFEGFNERTYMYGEENILFLNLLINKLKSVYITNIIVEHVGKGATKKAINMEKSRKIFEFKNSIIGWKVCLELLCEYKRKNKHELFEDIEETVE